MNSIREGEPYGSNQKGGYGRRKVSGGGSEIGRSLQGRNQMQKARVFLGQIERRADPNRGEGPADGEGVRFGEKSAEKEAGYQKGEEPFVLSRGPHRR